MRYSGYIGYAIIDTSIQGVAQETIVQKKVYGDVLRNSRKLQETAYTNSDIDINNEFSIVGNPTMRANIASMRFITWQGTKWRITSADASTYPRITIQVGGVYNENSY